MSSAPPPGAGASAWGFAKGLGQGAWAGAKSMATGIRDLAAMSADGWKQLGSLAKDLATDEQARDAAMQAIKDAAKQVREAGQWIADNPKETIANAKDGLLAAKNKAMEKGEELWESEKAAYRDARARGEGADFLGEAVGRTAFEVASLFIGVGEASKAGKLAKLTKAEGVMAKAGAEVLPCGKVVQKVKEAVGRNAYHGVTNPAAAQGILTGVDPARLNPNSRFGAAFYVAREPDTVLAELAHHGVTPTHAIRFELVESEMRVLNLTDPKIAKAYGYTGGPITGQTQQIGDLALQQGYNVIKYPSVRNAAGENLAILDDFDKILSPQMITPVK